MTRWNKRMVNHWCVYRLLIRAKLPKSMKKKSAFKLNPLQFKTHRHRGSGME